MIHTSILPEIRTLFGNDRFYFQQDGTPPHFQHVRAYLNENFPGQWIGRRDAVEFPPCSLDLTPLDFYLRGTLKGCGVPLKNGYIGGTLGRN